MSFAHPERLLWLLLLLPLAGFCAWGVARAAERRRLLLGEQADVLAPGFSRRRRLLRDGLLLLAFAGAVAAWAGPRWGTWMREVQRRGVDVVIVLDSSKSMLARDLSPNRLERARREVRGLLDRLLGDRVGLVAFAGDARVVAPLTHDPDTFRLFLDDVDTATCAHGGTAIGEGLELALDAFDPAVPNARAIVLLTDGEDTLSDPDPKQLAYKARAQEVPIHVVSFGTPEGGEIPLRLATGGSSVVKDDAGRPVISRPDEALLRSIADISEGSYLSAADTPFPLDELWDERIAVMEGVTRGGATREEGVDRFQWALVTALVCLGLAQVVPERRRA